MRVQLAIAIFVLALIVDFVIGEDEDEDYLDLIGPGGEIAPLNYTEHSPEFAAFMSEDYPLENESPDALGIDYTNYTPAFTEFMDPEWEPQPINYSEFSPAFTEFMDTHWEPKRPNVDDFPKWMLDFLGY